MSTSTSTAPSSHSLRLAYISTVMAVHAARAAPTRRVGRGPSPAPPVSCGSSTTIVWPSTSTSWVNPSRRRALTMALTSTPGSHFASRNPSLSVAPCSRGLPAREELRLGIVGEAGHRVGGVGGPVQVAQHLAAAEVLRLAERNCTALGATDRGPGQIQGGGEPAAAGDHELGGKFDAIHVAVDHRVEVVDHFGRDPADAVLEALPRLRGRRELRAGDEQLVLYAQDVGGDLLVAGLAERAGDAERGAGLVDGSVALGSNVGLRDAAAVPKRGGPVVPLLGVDLHHAADPSATPFSPQLRGLKAMPVRTLGKKKVDLGGMVSPSAATARTCSTGVGRRRKAAWSGPS